MSLLRCHFSLIEKLQDAFNAANVALLSALKNNDATNSGNDSGETKMDEDPTLEPALIDSLAASGCVADSSEDMEPIPYAEV